MKKYGWEQYTKRSKIIWKKNVVKKIKLKAKLPAASATKKPPLSSILATLNVNTENVINTFNTQTANKFTTDVLLPVIIKIDQKKNFIIKWNLPTIHEWLKTLNIHKKNKGITELQYKKKIIATIYKISIAKLKNKFKIKPIYKKMREYYGSVKSWDIYEQADHTKDKKRGKKKK